MKIYHSKETINFKLTIVCIVTSLATIGNGCMASHIISIYLQPYPTMANYELARKYNEKIKHPGKIAAYSIKSIMRDSLVAGIIATYGGYITISTLNGHIVFPNKQTQPSLYLLVTRMLSPIFMIGFTIHHWELEEGTPATLYKLEQKQDMETEQYYWEVTNKSLPDNKLIPADTIWIVAKPEKIYVPLGITLTDKSQNFILPNIYVKRGIMKLQNTFYMLNLKHFFAPVKKEYKQEKTYYLEQVM